MLVSRETQGQLREAAAKLHKAHWGRGAGQVEVHVVNDEVTVEFRQFCTPIERIALRHEENRDIVIELRRAALRETLGDWNRMFGEHGLEVLGVSDEGFDFDQDLRFIKFRVKSAGLPS